MNTLNRRMFANGDVANAQQNPGQMIDIPNLINYYVSQGYNSVDIKEMLPEVPMAVIESAVNSLGGSVNPAIASPGANEFTGDINPFVEMPETTTLANQQGDTTINPSFPVGAESPELPSEADISLVPEDIRRYMDATAGLFDDEGMVTAIMMNFDLSEEEARNIVGMSMKPNTNIDIIEPSLQQVSLTPKEDDLPEISDTQTSSNLKKLQIKDKKTNSTYTLPENFEQQVKERMIGGTTLYSIINNKDFEFSPDVAAILENFADMDEPFRVSQKIGGSFEERRGTFSGPGDFGYGTQEVGRQFGNIASPVLEGIAGFFGELGGGAQGRQAVQEFIPNLDVSKSDIGLARLLQIPGVSYTPPEVFDATKELEALATQETTPITTQEDSDVVTQTEEEINKDIEEETETLSTGDPAKQKQPGDTKDKENIPGLNTLSDDNDGAEQIASSIFGGFGEFFNSDANLRMMRNVGKGLTQYGNLAQRKSEEAIAGVKPLLKPSDIKGLDNMAKELNANVGFFEGGEASIAIMNDAISLFQEAVEKGVPITGLPGRFERFKDEAAAFAGYEKEASAATKIQNMIEQVKQRSIRAILQESGRTISDTDRDIVNRVFGELDLTSPPSEILKKLENARQSLVVSNIDKRDTISTTYKLMQNSAYGNVGTDAISSYKDLLEKIINSKDYSFDSPIILGNTDLGRSSAGIFIDAS